MNREEFTLAYLKQKGLTFKDGVLKSQKEKAAEAVASQEFSDLWGKQFKQYWSRLIKGFTPRSHTQDFSRESKLVFGAFEAGDFLDFVHALT